MARIALVLVTFLAITAAGTAVWAAVSLAAPVAVEPADAFERRANERVAVSFYDALNERLRGDGMATLQAVVTSDFSVHGPSFPVTSGLAVLDHQLADLQAGCPNCRLSIDALAVNDTLIAATVTARATGKGSALGLPVDGEVIAWTGHDRLRIEDGLVSEYWSVGAGTNAGKPIAEHVLLGVPSGVADLGVTHLALAPGSRLPGQAAPATRQVIVESGTLLLTINGLSAGETDTASVVARRRLLGPGMNAMVPADTSWELHNDGAAPVSAWVVSLRPFRTSVDQRDDWLVLGPETGERIAGVRQRVVATTVAASVPGGQLSLTLGRLLLGPGASIGPHDIAGTEIHAVGAGDLAVEATSQEVIIRRSVPGDHHGAGWTGNATLGAFDSVAIRGERVTAIRNLNAAPADIIVLLITPADPRQPSW